VRALHGVLIDMIFGSRENCLLGRAQLPTYSTVCPVPIERYWCDRADATSLLRGYEVWAGAPDAQTCSGDSGGPLLRTIADSDLTELVGVTSWGWASPAGDCAFGTVFALITDEARLVVARRPH
jgi:secreted trypsin-like serine protease